MNILLIEITHITYHFRFTNEYYSITCRTISSDAYYGALLIVEQGAQRYVSGGVDQFWENR